MKDKLEVSPTKTISMFVVGLIIFIITATNVIYHTTLVQKLDLNSLHALTNYFGKPRRHYDGPIWHKMMTFCANFGEVKSILYITLFLALILIFKNYKLSLWLLVTIYTGTYINFLIKQIIARPRPYNHLLVDHGYSFPSGHSNASTLFALAILLVVIPLIKNKAIRYSIAIVVVIFWIGVLSCRLYFHAHYLTDVIGGFSLGMIWIALFSMMLPLFNIKLKKK